MNDKEIIKWQENFKTLAIEAIDKTKKDKQILREIGQKMAIKNFKKRKLV